MVLQIITPETEIFDLPVTLPKSYLGKTVHCVFYTKEEAQNTPIQSSTKKKPSDFFGMLTKEEGESFEKHIKRTRNEWDRDI